MRHWLVPLCLGAFVLAPAVVAQQLGEATRAVLVAPGLASRTVEITDEFRESVRRSRRATSRVCADVRALKDFLGTTRKRISVVMRVPDALAVDPATGQTSSFRFEREMNLCAGGAAPGAK